MQILKAGKLGSPSPDSLTFLEFSKMIDPEHTMQIKEFKSQDEEERYLADLNELMVTMVMNPKKPGEESTLPLMATSEEWTLQKAKEGFFPPNREPYTKIKTIQAFKNLLDEDKQKYQRYDLKFFIRQYTQHNIDIINAYCRNCRSGQMQLGKKKIGLNRDKRTGYYSLRFFDNQHYHHFHETVQAKRSGYGLLKHLKHQFQNSPKDMHVQDFILFMTKKYKTTQKAIKHLLYVYRRQTQHFKQIVDLSNMVNSQFWFKNQIEDEEYISKEEAEKLEGEPELFIFIFNDMFERYADVGEVSYFMILDFVLSGEVDRKWKVITFTGLSLGYILEPFAFAYIDLAHMTIPIISDILGFIFNQFKKAPRVLITPGDLVYDELVYTMKTRNIFHGLHFYDPIIEIDKIGSSLVKYQELAYFKNIILCRTKTQFNQNIQKLFQRCQPTLPIRASLNRVLKLSHRLCFSCIKSTEYIGPIFDFSANKLVKEVLRESMMKKGRMYLDQQPVSEKCQAQDRPIDNYVGNPLKKFIAAHSDLSFASVPAKKLSFTRCVKSMMNLMRRNVTKIDNSSNYDLKPYETVIEMPDMVAIRRSIKTNLFAIFGQQYGKIYYLDYFQRPNRQYGQLKIYDIYDRQAKSLFVVAPEPFYNSDGSFQKMIIRCNCLLSLKCGIPCAHEILTTMLAKSSLIDLFKQNFKVSQKYKRSGRPRLTRRNTQK